MKKTTVVIALLAMMVVPASAQKGGASEDQLVKNANELFDSGQYLKAYPLYSQLVSLYPQHAEYNYKFGACAIYSDPDKTKAIRYLTSATNKGVQDPMAWYYLGKAHHLNYEFKPAIKAYEDFLSKADPKLAEKTNAHRDIETCVYGSGLLSNIKDVVVLNKTESDRENFFRYFNLEEIGGRILSVPDQLKSKLDEKSKDPGVMYYPGNGTTIYFSSYGKDGATGKDIYKAQILPDGKFSVPEKVSGGVNTKYDEDFCFMHSDGKTLYFSSKGHNSMGGYDIFKCDMDASGNFGPAINLDFAVNTPDDDIFYCVDSKNEKAYFASARTSDQGHLHVYNVMVQGIPLNIIYIKGEFINEINPDQKTAGLTIKGIMGGAPVSENTSDPYTGKYVVYAPKGGQYKLEVATTNSPIVHNSLMNVPAFDKPVAVRQEIRLVKENGVEKLIVNNYFEEVLNEDIASLAADMLRKKARLDVNATDEMVKAASTADLNEPEIAVEKTMDNAVLAAGFQEGITVPAVVDMMEADIRKMEEFVSTADQKSAASLNHAMKKYQEAETLLARAESLRRNTDPSKGESYLESMRESHRLSLEAENLRREANSAIASAEAMSNYRVSENQRKEDLRTRMHALTEAEKSNDFNTALAELKLEKDRQTALRGGNANPTLDEMNAKVRAKEGEEKASLEKLDRLRNDEKSLNTDIRIAEEKMNSAKKKDDKEAAEMEFATLKGKLDAKRKEILNETIRAERLGKESADIRGQAKFYASLLDGSHDLDMNQTAVVSENEKNTVRAKLREMDSRLDALEITDPQMLALLGDMKEEQPLASNHDIPVSTDHNIGRMREGKDARLSQYSGNDYAMVAGRRMVLNREIDGANNAIATFERKGESRLTDTEKAELTALRNYRTELKAEMAGQVVPQPVVSGFDVNVVYAAATPGYKEKINSPANSSDNDIERNIKAREVKLSTLNNLESLRAQNAEQALANTDPSKTSELAMKDVQYALAIDSLTRELYDTASLRTAFESENKDIIESDLVYADKLSAQIELTQDYSQGLTLEEAALRSRLEKENDPDQKEKIELALAAVSKEKQQADTRVNGYQKDLDLTLAASGPSSIPATPNTQVSGVPAEATPVKTEVAWNFDVPAIKGDDEESKSQAEKDSEAMIQIFKPVKEEESIYAYETGVLDELSYKYSTDSTEIRNRDKIVETSDNIFLIEAEIENEKNPLKQRKLDRDAEKLYLKKALLEIGNAESIRRMTNAEFDVLLEEVKKLNAENKAKIDSRVMLKDEVKSLFNKAKDEMEDAAILRKRAYPVVDDIEKNDYFRRAFAKEVYALNLLKQLKTIHENLDMMLQYDDQQLAALRYGKLEMFDKPAESELASNTVSTEASNGSAVNNSSSGTSNLPSTTTATKSTSVAVATPASAPGQSSTVVKTPASGSNDGMAVDSRRVTSQGTSTVVPATSVQTTISTGTTVVPNTGNSSATIRSTEVNPTGANTNASAPSVLVKRTETMSEGTVSTRTASAGEVAQSMVNNGTVQGATREDLMSSPEFLDYTSLLEEASMLDAKRMAMIRERNQLAAENNEIADQVAALEVARANATTQEERDALQKQIDKLAADHARNLELIRVKDMEIESLAVKIRDINAKAEARYASISSGNITVFSAGSAVNSSTNAAPAETRSASSASGNSASEARAAGGAYSRAEAERMLFSYPTVLEKELFLTTNKSVYSESKPIPVDIDMPQGVYYRVQVGAFRNRIPQDLYDQFAPVSGESLSNGITRYSAGFFLDFNQANKVKTSIRGIGYGDAFVVAYRDGKRIPLYEAMALTEGDFQASVENEYVFGDNSSKKSTSAPAATNGNLVVKSAAYYDYNKYPNAVRANQVEVMSGLFYTVQVGVYSKPVPAASVYNITPLNSEQTANKMIRYSSGVYTDMESAVVKRDEARRLGIGDAFITAYYNGTRISLTEADKLIRENGDGIFLRK